MKTLFVHGFSTHSLLLNHKWLLLFWLKVFLFLLVTFFTVSFQAAEGVYDELAIPLFHRDKVYNPSSTIYERNQMKFDRDLSRATDNISLSSTVFTGQLEYLMVLAIGTPPRQVYVTVDTGSELLWVQCFPCKHCHKQKTPLFDPSESSKYKKLQCHSPPCNTMGSVPMEKIQCKSNHLCTYQETYADYTSTNGTLSLDKFDLEQRNKLSTGTTIKVKVGYITVGCSHELSESYTSNPGLVGFYRGPLSLISQLRIKSYCLAVRIPNDDEGSDQPEGKMYFGSQVMMFGGRTPLVKAGFDEFNYFVNLQGISVGNQKLPIPTGIFDITEDGQGGFLFLVDSGTSLTTLRSEALDALVEALSKAINLPENRNYQNTYELCFEGSIDDLALQSPNVIFHLNSTDLILTTETTYLEVENGIWCFAMSKSGSWSDYPSSILGVVEQANHYIAYDLEEEMIWFAPLNCANF